MDRPPLDAIGPDNYWKTAADLENYVIQYYPSFPGHGTWYNGYGYSILNADNAINNTPNIVLNGERGSTNGRWISDWTRIRSINIFFENYQKCEDDFETYKHYLGEAYFFKSWYYFNLVNQYGDVPWYNTQLLPNQEEQLLRPRDPRTLVVDSILANLDKAIEYLDVKTNVGNNRINKEVALAFKSRIALFEGSWQKYHAGTVFGTPNADPSKYFRASVEAAEELINGQYQVGLHPDYYELFGMDDMSGVNEVLLYTAYSLEEGVYNDVQYATVNFPVRMGATWSLVSSYLNKNGEPYDLLGLAQNEKGNGFLSTLAEDLDPRFFATIWTPGALMVTRSNQLFDKPLIDQVETQLNPTGFQIKKCSNPDSPGAGIGGGGSSETGYIIFRYGEVLLNYAEALYELDGTIAYDVLNQIRSRAGMPEFSINSQSSDPDALDYGYPVSDELYEIRRERRVELALEGFRSKDYRRWAAHALFKGKRPKGYPFDPGEFPNYQPPVDENGRIDYFQDRLPNGYQFREGQDYISAIPAEELTLNPNLEQNPGW